MLMKKLIVFKNETNFKKELEQGNIMPTSWVVVKDTKKLYVQNTEIEGVNWDKVQQLIDTAISDLDLENKLSSFVEKTELENYYTKTESDGKYLTEHQSLEDYYNKTQVENKLNEKADKSSLENYYTKTESDDKYLTEHQSLSNYYQKNETYSKEEVDNLIEDIDVTDQLEDYVKKEEYTKITDSSDNIIQSVQFVEGEENGEVEVYTKSQCDLKFALKSEIPTDYLKIWQGSQSDYDNLGTYNNNTIYVIL